MNLFQKQLILGNGKSMAELPYAHRFGPPLPPLRVSIEDFEGAKMSTTTQPTEDRCEFVFRSNSGRLTICGLSASEHDPLYVRHKFFSQLSAPRETPAQQTWIKVAHILHVSAHCNLSWDTCKLLAQRIAKECIVNRDPAFRKVMEDAQAVVDCFGLGQSPEKFVKQVTGFIEDLREALRLAREETE